MRSRYSTYDLGSRNKLSVFFSSGNYFGQPSADASPRDGADAIGAVARTRVGAWLAKIVSAEKKH